MTEDIGLIVAVDLGYSFFQISTQDYSYHFFKWDMCGD